jgi:curved DNA-binding protein CbpA
MVAQSPQLPNEHYTVLGCKKNASADELKRAYRRCVIESHPDKGGTPEQFQAVRLAAEVLCDEDRRVEYDVRSRIAARMRQIEKDYEQSMGAAGGAYRRRASASASARARKAAEVEKERGERMDSEWRVRAQSAREDHEQRWKKARARTAAFEEKWDAAFKEFAAKREEETAAANAAHASRGKGAGQRRAFSARGPRTTTWAAAGTGAGAGAGAGAGKTPAAAADKEQQHQYEKHPHQENQQQQNQQQPRESQGRATVFAARGRFECYHSSRTCKALLIACGAPVEHDFHFATRVERRKPCRFCCKETTTAATAAAAAAAAAAAGGDSHGHRRPATATGAPRPRSALSQKLPRRNYSGSSYSSPFVSPAPFKRDRPASASAAASSSPGDGVGAGDGVGGGGGGGGGGDDAAEAGASRGGAGAYSPAAPLRYAAPKGKLHHSSASCPCLVGRAGVQELPPAELRGLRACGTC